jgi:hypothetical protein
MKRIVTIIITPLLLALSCDRPTVFIEKREVIKTSAVEIDGTSYIVKRITTYIDEIPISSLSYIDTIKYGKQIYYCDGQPARIEYYQMWEHRQINMIDRLIENEWLEPNSEIQNGKIQLQKQIALLNQDTLYNSSSFFRFDFNGRVGDSCIFTFSVYDSLITVEHLALFLMNTDGQNGIRVLTSDNNQIRFKGHSTILASGFYGLYAIWGYDKGLSTRLNEFPIYELTVPINEPPTLQ